jgi:hypothetical protein
VLELVLVPLVSPLLVPVALPPLVAAAPLLEVDPPPSGDPIASDVVSPHAMTSVIPNPMKPTKQSPVRVDIFASL